MASAEGETRFTNAADSAGITYQNPPTGRIAEREEIIANLPTPVAEFLSEVRPNYAMNPFGAPGVALLDFDGDGDLDIYATNGPGAANSLYSNQLRESGVLSFHDVAVASGTDATAQDSSGVCYGDIDNDGDPDLYVLGLGEENLLLRNEGDGTFTDITAASGTAGGQRHPTSCSFGDIDNDGLLDLLVGNTFDDWNHRLATVTVETYPGLEHNQLFHNLGGGTFADVSAAAGIENVSNMSGPGLSGAAHTWALSLVDFDQDGDVDIISADNQGAAATQPSERRGWNRLFENDGTGHFTDVTEAVGLDVEGSWMGLTFGDYNCDGSLDFFSTNVGDYEGPGRHSTLFLGSEGGSFATAGPPEANVFGWGASSLDYDNDGDQDVIYHGGLDFLNLLFLVNPGVLYTNEGECSGVLRYDA
ncbi:MAG: VCBS repeat-containing protein, partial [Acidobacteria bacterium]|nr:VCBS repeat-containing protein [Acidobacteriota bacterium]